MMKKMFSPVCLSLVSLLIITLFSSCGSGGIAAALGEEFTLPAGETATISEESLSIKFVEVTGDSRCPSDVVCIQAGDAKCSTVFRYKSRDYDVTLTAGGTNPANVVFEGYDVDFNLQPYPVSTTQIKPEDYRLIMTVTKTSSLSPP